MILMICFLAFLDFQDSQTLMIHFKEGQEDLIPMEGLGLEEASVLAVVSEVVVFTLEVWITDKEV